SRRRSAPPRQRAAVAASPWEAVGVAGRSSARSETPAASCREVPPRPPAPPASSREAVPAGPADGGIQHRARVEVAEASHYELRQPGQCLGLNRLANRKDERNRLRENTTS